MAVGGGTDLLPSPLPSILPFCPGRPRVVEYLTKPPQCVNKVVSAGGVEAARSPAGGPGVCECVCLYALMWLARLRYNKPSSPRGDAATHTSPKPLHRGTPVRGHREKKGKESLRIIMKNNGFLMRSAVGGAALRGAGRTRERSIVLFWIYRRRRLRCCCFELSFMKRRVRNQGAAFGREKNISTKVKAL